MTFSISVLRTSPAARFFAQTFTRCTVALTSGKKVTVEKSNDLYGCSYEKPVSEVDEAEAMEAMMLLGI